VNSQAKAWQSLERRPLFTALAKEEVLDRLVKNFWMDKRTLQDDDYATPIADDLIMMKMKKELKILPDGHIELPTLWKQGPPQTQNNFECAKTRLFQLLGSKLMTSDPTLMDKYQVVFKKWQDSGFIELIQDDNPTRPNLWYWPHFPVIKDEKETTKKKGQFLTERQSFVASA
jgi:hypothetical protein